MASPATLWAISLLLLLLAPRADAQTPFCGYNSQRNVVSVALACTSPGATISHILFASYGTPGGSCPSYSVNASCNAPQSMQLVQQACLNQSFCTVTMGNNDQPPDPCEGVVKALAIVATCSTGGGYQPIDNPSCATTDGFPPCPLPSWPATWRLSRSTICQPGNTAGFLNATEAAQWGLISLDWSVANGVWYKGNASNATCAEVLVEQCRQIKAVNNDTKCFVYRNTELALEWLSPQRAVMDDPASAHMFLLYLPGNPEGAPPGTIYEEDAGPPCPGCQQFFWNYSNPATVQYVLNVSEQGALGTGSPYVDGTFLDDSQAIPQEHPNAPANIGLSALQLIQIQNDTHNFVQLTIDTLAARSWYIWQAFNNNPGGDPDEVAPAPSQGSCQDWMEMVCEPSWQRVPMTMQWGNSDKEQILAGFLIGRGPYAYVGYGWNGGPLPEWDPMWDVEYGEPTELCQQSEPGVFSRGWTSGTVTLDCNSWTATLPPGV